MTALAIMTADPGSQGDGGGDMYRLAYDNDKAAGRKSEGPWEPLDFERIHYETKPVPAYRSGPGDDYRIRGESGPGDDYRIRCIVPKYAGRWTGDRIVIAGDYGKQGEHLTKQQLGRGLVENFHREVQRRIDQSAELARGPSQPSEWVMLTTPVIPQCNLYKYAEYFFTDVSAGVLQAMHAYGIGGVTDDSITEHVEGYLSHRLLVEYEPKQLVGRGKHRRYQWDLAWLSYTELDSLLRCSEGHIAQVKKWLRRQKLLPWQREILHCYNDVFSEMVSYSQLTRVLQKHKITYDGSGTYPVPRLLPAGFSAHSNDTPPITKRSRRVDLDAGDAGR